MQVLDIWLLCSDIYTFTYFKFHVQRCSKRIFESNYVVFFSDRKKEIIHHTDLD